jgi:hypothetical protein
MYRKLDRTVEQFPAPACKYKILPQLIIAVDYANGTRLPSLLSSSRPPDPLCSLLSRPLSSAEDRKDARREGVPSFFCCWYSSILE